MMNNDYYLIYGIGPQRINTEGIACSKVFFLYPKGIKSCGKVIASVQVMGNKISSWKWRGLTLTAIRSSHVATDQS